MSTQCVGYDFTLPKATNPDRGLIIKFLNDWCKKWVFQEEFAPSRDDDGEIISVEVGYAHWQGRVSLIKKVRLTELCGTAKLPGIHWSVTSKTVHEGQNFNYVMKAATRVDGPWEDKDFVDPPKLTRQLKHFHDQEKYPWQVTVAKWCDELDDRSIKLLIDTVGNGGKSILAEDLEYHGKAYEIPPFRLMEDIMACVMSVGEKKAYIIDMPRAMKKDKLSEFYAGLESLKNGVCYDKRYSFKKRRMDRPQVIVFTNKEPCYEYMSLDRWEIWHMCENKSLKKSSGAAL